MSGRAIRKLREDREAALALAAEDDSEEEEDSDHDHSSGKVKSAFVRLNDSDSDSDSEDKSSQKENETDETTIAVVPTAVAKEEEEKEENLDALLEEFKEQDDKKPVAVVAEDAPEAVLVSTLVLGGIEWRDLDVDHVLRTSLLTARADAVTDPSGGNRRRNRPAFLFGNPLHLNVPPNVKPPHFVGGGIGMSRYDRDTESHRSIPWPYGDLEPWRDRKRWYTFTKSDSYQRDCSDFMLIQDSGDVNAMVWFVAHHPFVTDALVNLGRMLYHANQAQEALVFLRRSLWVYESATLAGFTNKLLLEQDQCFMDFDQLENQTYFQALFLLARVNHMAGLCRSSFAIGRYLLSLDPLRDPRGILLALDCYALSNTSGEGNEQWLVNLIESKTVKIHYRDEAIDYQCDLADLPNWSYSYALALFRIHDSRPSEQANRALKAAISKFPGIVDLFLSENDVDITSRSCRLDWQAVIDYTGSRSNAIHLSEAMNAMDPLVRMATEKAHDWMIRIAAKLNHKLWSSDAVMLWLYSNLEELKANDDRGVEEWQRPVPMSPAWMRYSGVDPGDYETKFQLLPAEANFLDPGIVQHALVIDPNRRRLLRNQRGGRGNNNDMMMMDEDDNFALFPRGPAVRPLLLGPPTHVIDLDWPMMEVFWRSLLPWNRIEEIPKPRR